MDTFERGEDIFRNPILKIEGEAADTADFTTIEVRVFHSGSKKEIGSYLKAAGTVSTPAPTTDGIIEFIISRSENRNAQIGTYSYEAKTTEVDADYEDGSRTRKFIGECFELVWGNE